jgi:hypothetical protein
VNVGRFATVRDLKKKIEIKLHIPQEEQNLEVHMGRNITISKDDNDPITSFFDRGAAVYLHVIKRE